MVPALLALLGLALVAAPASGGPDGVGEALAAALLTPELMCGETRLDPQRLASYYLADRSTPLWTDARARRLLAALDNVGQHGLPASRYGSADIEALASVSTRAARACRDLLLTAAFDRYSRDLRGGYVGPQEADPSWQLRPTAFDPVAALQAAGSDDEFSRLLDTLPPTYPEYARLQAALADYRRRAEQGGWPELPSGPQIEPGARHEQVPLLRTRLRREGDLPSHILSFGSRYDPRLVEALRRFQRRHGLTPDGIVGARTRAALNVPVAERSAQLRRALERMRWLPRELGDHYIRVNTAGFELAVVEGGKTVLRMRTINGTPDQATPSFTATLQTLIVNPYWYVPTRIARDKLWPREQARPGYLAARGFRVFDTRNGWRELDLARVDRSHFNGNQTRVRLRQEPGPKNLLGRLSFVLPNPYDVFLHDTPERALFERDLRTFSEGCVRIESPMVLALHTLRRLPEWTEARLQEEIDALHHRTLTLPEPIPVYVLYLPTWVDDDGQVQFRNDPYGREQVLTRLDPTS